ncbi:MAG: FAD-dependent oxidoreductase [bacterium]|nr:FAD-dependent oxidoreductase [bacterium]
MAQIIIVGGSHGGVNAAHTLAHRLGREHRIILISAVDEFVYRPTLVHLAMGLRTAKQIRRPLAPGLRRRGIEFVQDTVEHIDPQARRVTGRTGEHDYDFLVVAPGARADWSGLPGGAEHAHTLLWMDDAVRLRQAIDSFRGGSVVIGMQRGGELPCPLYEVPLLLDAYLVRRGLRGQTTITAFSYEKTPYALAGPRASRLGARILRNRNIGFIGGTTATRIEPGRVRLEDGAELPSDLTFIMPPYKGRDVVQGLEPPTADGMLPVDDYMRSTRHDDVYAVGDAVDVDGPKTGRIAQQQGKVAGSNIAALLQGKKPVALYNSEYLCVLDLGLGGGLGWLRRPSPGQGRPVNYLGVSGPPVKWGKLVLERAQLAKLR